MSAAVSPGRYVEMILGVASSLLIILLCGVSLPAVIRDPDPPALIVLVISCLLILGPWGLWISIYALWFSDRPEIEVDDQGVRLKAALYRHIPWADVLGVGSALSLGRELGPCIFLAEGRGVRTVVWPFRTQRLRLAMRVDQQSPSEIADIICKHPNFRGKAIAP